MNLKHISYYCKCVRMKKLFGHFWVRGKIKHAIHCCLLIGWIILATYLNYRYKCLKNNFNNIAYYGYTITIIIFVIRLMIAYLMLFNLLTTVLGLLLYNSFDDNTISNFPPASAPFLCFRIVTRGFYPNLVMKNVEKNKNICIDAGLTNFIIQVVTDIEIPLPSGDQYIMQTVVPGNYCTKNGVKFKGRALQYAIENSPSLISDDDWIIHLDEESVLTRNAVHGIINFVCSDEYDIGAGMICYSKGKGANWFVNLIDFFRTADDMGRLRFQLRCIHRLLSDWHGSFLVMQVKTETDVSFDGGNDSCLTEDLFFGLKAASKGYSFDFIDGNMWEISPFTIVDAIRQRKRWYEGGEKVARSSQIPFFSKLLLFLNMYIGTLAVVILTFANDFVLPLAWDLRIYYDVAITLSAAIMFYLQVYGIIKTYILKKQFSILTLLFYILLSPVATAANLILPAIAVWWALLSHDKTFKIVQKEVPKSLPV